jgi:hypothetical protein
MGRRDKGAAGKKALSKNNICTGPIGAKAGSDGSTICILFINSCHISSYTNDFKEDSLVIFKL